MSEVGLGRAGSEGGHPEATVNRLVDEQGTPGIEDHAVCPGLTRGVGRCDEVPGEHPAISSLRAHRVLAGDADSTYFPL